MAPTPSATLDGMLDVEQLAAKFRMHPVTVRRFVADRVWPSTKIGRRIWFTPEQVAEILRICERPAVESPRKTA